MRIFNPAKTPISGLLALLLSAVTAQAGAQVVREGALLSPVTNQERTVPGFYRLMLGKFEITALSDGTVTLPLDKLLTNTTPAQLKKLLGRAGVDPQAAEISINAYLVHTGERIVLIDTGAGSLFPNGGRILQSLSAAGYSAEDITDVMIRFCRVVDQTAEIGRKRSCAPHTGRTTPAIAENWSANDIASAPSISN